YAQDVRLDSVIPILSSLSIPNMFSVSPCLRGEIHRGSLELLLWPHRLPRPRGLDARAQRCDCLRAVDDIDYGWPVFADAFDEVGQLVAPGEAEAGGHREGERWRLLSQVDRLAAAVGVETAVPDGAFCSPEADAGAVRRV